ncbi:hypothetical protein [Accumulibacter sp.]|nr:hypothetical protein [Accumulibacter sp.]
MKFNTSARTAQALLLVESAPHHKDPLIRLVVNLLPASDPSS